jgi:Domain of unknown function (DUF4105)
MARIATTHSTTMPRRNSAAAALVLAPRARRAFRVRGGLQTLAALVTLAALASPAHAQGVGRPGRDTDSTLPPEIAKLYEDKPVIELVTMGVGSLIWERHGHIALCVREADSHDDRCYNYGIGDFRHPLGMAWGFFRGTQSFWVGKASVSDMLSIYLHADRTIWVQPLPLTAEQKKQVIAKLEHDILEPNKFYAYDHFWDNCTTRVRNVIDEAIGGKLAAMNEPTDGRTFRDLAREGFYGMRVPLLVTDLAMGRVTDRVPTYHERMFLPQYLREAVHKLWGIAPIAAYERRGPPAPPDGPSGRVWFAIVIVLLTSPAWVFRRLGRRGGNPGRLARIGLAVSILPYVLLGSVLLFLAIISPLPYVRWNETCLVLLPLDVLALVLSPLRRRLYARGRLVMLAALAMLDLVGVIKQPLLAAILWPAIPLAVVGLWPDRTAAVGRLDATPHGAARKSGAARKRH